MSLLIAGLVALLLVSSGSDTRWGRGVRGAARGVSSKDTRGVKDRVSSVSSGFVSGWKDTPPKDTPRDTPRGQRTLLQNLTAWARNKVSSGRCPHCRRTDQQCPWCRYGEDGDTWLIREPGRPDRHVAADHNNDQTFPRVGSGAQMWLVDRRTLQSTPFSDLYSGQPWQLHDPDYEPVLRLGYTAPAVGGQDVDSVHGWTPGDPTPRSVDGFDVIDPKTGQVTGHLSGGDLDQMSAEAAELYPNKHDTTEGDLMDSGLAAGPKPAPFTPVRPPQASGWAPAPAGAGVSAGAIENLPDYRRYLASALTRALGELEDAQAGAQRHRDQAVSIAEGVSRLIALRADPATAAEGNRVAEQAQLAAEASSKLAAQLGDLVDAVKAAIGGAARHDQVQESHDSGVHLEHSAYQGS